MLEHTKRGCGMGLFLGIGHVTLFHSPNPPFALYRHHYCIATLFNHLPLKQIMQMLPSTIDIPKEILLVLPSMLGTVKTKNFTRARFHPV